MSYAVGARGATKEATLTNLSAAIAAVIVGSTPQIDKDGNKVEKDGKVVMIDSQPLHVHDEAQVTAAAKSALDLVGGDPASQDYDVHVSANLIQNDAGAIVKSEISVKASLVAKEA